MKVINSLIAVEVPRGAAEHQLRSEYGANLVVYKNHEAYHYEQLPFPAEIIGLASEIDDFQRMLEVMKAANAERGTTWYYFTYINKLTTTPTTARIDGANRKKTI